MFENVIHQLDHKNEWLLLLASFTAKFGLAFVLTLENVFSYMFHFQANTMSIQPWTKHLETFSLFRKIFLHHK